MKEVKHETQAYSIGDAVTVDMVGEIETVSIDPWTKKIQYKVSFGENGNAYLFVDALTPAPTPENTSR